VRSNEVHGTSLGTRVCARRSSSTLPVNADTSYNELLEHHQTPTRQHNTSPRQQQDNCFHPTHPHKQHNQSKPNTGRPTGTTNPLTMVRPLSHLTTTTIPSLPPTNNPYHSPSASSQPAQPQPQLPQPSAPPRPPASTTPSATTSTSPPPRPKPPAPPAQAPPTPSKRASAPGSSSKTR
jgi:hypothetical protein